MSTSLQWEARQSPASQLHGWYAGELLSKEADMWPLDSTCFNTRRICIKALLAKTMENARLKSHLLEQDTADNSCTTHTRNSDRSWTCSNFLDILILLNVTIKTRNVAVDLRSQPPQPKRYIVQSLIIGHDDHQYGNSALISARWTNQLPYPARSRDTPLSFNPKALPQVMLIQIHSCSWGYDWIFVNLIWTPLKLTRIPIGLRSMNLYS